MADTIDISKYLDRPDLSRLSQLQAQLRQKPALGFCGAGMSIPVGFPSWRQLLKLFLQYIVNNSDARIPSDLQLAINSKDPMLLPESFKVLKGFITEELYMDFLKQTFSRFVDIDYSFEYELLAKIPIRLWITTNYDNCLIDALCASMGKSISVIDTIPFDKLLDGDTLLPEVVYWHGQIQNPNSIVLTSEDYQAVYFSRQNASVQLKGLAAFPILFIGYSLNEEELNSHFRSLNAILNGSIAKKFAILPKAADDNSSLVQIHTTRLSTMGITPIYYKQYGPSDHKGREILLNSLISRNCIENVDTEIRLSWRDSFDYYTLRTALKQVHQESRAQIRLKKCNFDMNQIVVSIAEPDQRAEFTSIISKHSILHIGEAAPVVHNLEKTQTEIKVKEKPETQIEIEGDTWNLSASRDVLTSSSILNESDFQEIAPGENFVQNVKLDSELKYKATAHAQALCKAKTISESTTALQKPLMGIDLHYSISDLFHPYITWKPGSPVLHCYIYYREYHDNSYSDPVEITIIGTGITWMRRQLENVAYFASLVLDDPKNTLLITNNLIHISTINYVKKSQNRSHNLIQRILSSVSKPDSDFLHEFITSNINPIQGIVSALKKLNSSNGMLKIFDYPYRNITEYKGILRKQIAMMESQTAPVLIKPRENNPAVSCFEIPDYPFLDRGVLKLTLSIDVIKTDIFRELCDSFYREMLENIAADIERRMEFYRSKIDSLENEHQWFKKLPQEEQDKIPDVKTNIMLDKDLGIDILIEESYISAKKYYLDNIPNYLIPDHKKELNRLTEEAKPLERILNEKSLPFEQLCISRLFDCALRGQKPMVKKQTTRLFDSWVELVSPMLELEITNVFKEKGFDIHDSIKNGVIDIKIDEKSNKLDVYFYIVIDSTRNTIVVDKKRRTLALFDILDSVKKVPAPIDLRQDMFLKRYSQGIKDIKQLNDMRNELYKNPGYIGFVCEFIRSVIPNAFKYSDIKEIVKPKAQAAVAAQLYNQLEIQNCQFSARAVLAPENEFVVPPGKALILAYINCIDHNLDPFSTLKKLRCTTVKPFDIPIEIFTRFKQAEKQNKNMVNSFLEFKTVPNDELEDLSNAERAVYKIETVLEGIKIFNQLSQSLKYIRPDGDSLERIFYLVSDAFESIYKSVYYPLMPGVARIQSILLGKPLEK